MIVFGVMTLYDKWDSVEYKSTGSLTIGRTMKRKQEEKSYARLY